MTTTWRRHDDDMTTTWRWHDDDMTTTWWHDDCSGIKPFHSGCMYVYDRSEGTFQFRQTGKHEANKTECDLYIRGKGRMMVTLSFPQFEARDCAAQYVEVSWASPCQRVHGNMSMSTCPWQHVHDNMSMTTCPWQRVHVNMSMSTCPFYSLFLLCFKFHFHVIIVPIGMGAQGRQSPNFFQKDLRTRISQLDRGRPGPTSHPVHKGLPSVHHELFLHYSFSFWWDL